MSGDRVQGYTSEFVDNEAHGQSRASSYVYHEAWGDACRPTEPLRLDHEALAEIRRTVHPVCADYEALGNAIRTSCPLSADLEASRNANHTPHPLVLIMRVWVTSVVWH